jgi:uncharacterized protein
MAGSSNKKVQFVIKSSKFCNLRCRYCYEYAELGNREAIALEQLEQMYKNIASYYTQLEHPTDIDFIWHGGEPLLQHPDYYWRAFDLQQQIFEPLTGSVRNAVQTNLTVLNKERLRLLREGFDAVGVSVDLFGGLRVDRSGVNSQATVLTNMERLREENISFGCVTVLTKLNLPYVQEIYEFYESRGIHFRLLPLFDGAFDGQHAGYEIDASEVLSAFRTIFELWLASKNPVAVEPLATYIKQIFNHYSSQKKTSIYNKREWEWIYLLNVNGDVYSYADAYNPEFSHGNLFTTPLAEIISGTRHQKVVDAAEKRIVSACKSCPYFGSCSGYPAAEESVGYHQVDIEGNAKCVQVKGILEYMERRFKQVGIINPITGSLNVKGHENEEVLALNGIW